MIVLRLSTPIPFPRMNNNNNNKVINPIVLIRPMITFLPRIMNLHWFLPFNRELCRVNPLSQSFIPNQHIHLFLDNFSKVISAVHNPYDNIPLSHIHRFYQRILAFPIHRRSPFNHLILLPIVIISIIQSIPLNSNNSHQDEFPDILEHRSILRHEIIFISKVQRMSEMVMSSIGDLFLIIHRSD